MSKARGNPPQNGAVTHHQDHVMYPVSFKATNKTPNNPKTPIPLLDELLF